jgi:hypothetical protein
MFKDVVTETGVCYTYNSLETDREQNRANDGDDIIEDWSLEGELLNVYPRKGSKYSLYLCFNVFKER